MNIRQQVHGLVHEVPFIGFVEVQVFQGADVPVRLRLVRRGSVGNGGSIPSAVLQLKKTSAVSFGKTQAEGCGSGAYY